MCVRERERERERRESMQEPYHMIAKLNSDGAAGRLAGREEVIKLLESLYPQDCKFGCILSALLKIRDTISGEPYSVCLSHGPSTHVRRSGTLHTNML